MAEHIIAHIDKSGYGVTDGGTRIPKTLPGERISGTPVDGQILDLKIVHPSSDRVSPRCRHYKTCGGCQLQHASDRFVQNWKRERVVDSLRSAGLPNVVRNTVETSPMGSRRRLKVAAKRTKSGSICGYRARKTHTIVDIHACPLLQSQLGGVFDLGRELALIGASRKSELSITATQLDSGLDVLVEAGSALEPSLMQRIPELARDFGCVRLIWGSELVFQAETPTKRIGTASVPLPPGAFLQATEHAEITLQSYVRDCFRGQKHVLDLFSGCGTFALAFAQDMHVTAVEGDREMTQAMQAAANQSALRYDVIGQTRDLFRDPLLSSELSGFDAVVLDPPRTGALNQVKEVVKSSVPLIAYVSCNPYSFAQDASVLANAGFHMRDVLVVDQFRWSTHIELAATFEKR